MARIQEVASSVLLSLGLAMLATGVMLASPGRVWADGGGCECDCGDEDQECWDACVLKCGLSTEPTCYWSIADLTCVGQCKFSPNKHCPVGKTSRPCPCD